MRGDHGEDELGPQRALEGDPAWLRQVVDHAREGLWVVDLDGRTLAANRRMAELLRCGAADLVGASVFDFLVGDQAEGVRRNLERRRRGEVDQHERVFRRADGTTLVALVSAGPITDRDGCHIGSFALMSDITERTDAEIALAEREARLRALFDHASVGQILISPDGRILHANRAAERMTGTPPGGLVGRRPLDHSRVLDRAAVLELGRAIADGTRDDGDVEVGYELPDGRSVRLLASIGVVRRPDGSPDYLTAVVQDVTERRQAEERLAALAHYDAITGLANRTSLDLRMERALAVPGSRVAVLFIDLDGFKVVNDTLGHAVGDQVLAAIAERMRNATRPGDTTARFGGDEFVVVAPIDHDDDGRALAERLLATVRAPLEADSGPIDVRMSIGVTVGGAGSTAAALLDEADMAMYRAKEMGGDRAECFAAGMTSRRRR